MIAVHGQTYTSFFLLAAVLPAPKIASRKNFSGTPDRGEGNPSATPDFIRGKPGYGYDVASDLCVFVKNHLGSTMLTVDDRGRYSTGRAHDYLAYGSHKDLKVGSSDPVTQKFTGKELEALSGLYAFGWRTLDSDLGIWTSPDPDQQFFNPYSYNGGDPINSIDPDGRRCDVVGPNGDVVIDVDPEACKDKEEEVETSKPPQGPTSEPEPPATYDPITAVIVLGAAVITNVFASVFGGNSDGPNLDNLDCANCTVNEVAAANGSQNPNVSRKYFEHYWKSGMEKLSQSKSMVEGERYVDIEQFVSGAWDLGRAAKYYGGDPNPTVTFATPNPLWLGGRRGGGIGKVGSSRALGKVLEASGNSRQLKVAAHHIVARDAPAAAQARAILQKFGIGIDDAANGVFLPANSAAPNAAGSAVHSTIHTNNYYNMVNQMLGAATSRAEAMSALETIRRILLSGGVGY